MVLIKYMYIIFPYPWVQDIWFFIRSLNRYFWHLTASGVWPLAQATVHALFYMEFHVCFLWVHTGVYSYNSYNNTFKVSSVMDKPTLVLTCSLVTVYTLQDHCRVRACLIICSFSPCHCMCTRTAWWDASVWSWHTHRLTHPDALLLLEAFQTSHLLMLWMEQQRNSTFWCYGWNSDGTGCCGLNYMDTLTITIPLNSFCSRR